MPTVSNDCANGTTPAVETVPCVGRIPYSPQYDAGTRIEPAVSVPNPRSARPPATAAAGPLVEPPVVHPGAEGLGGVWKVLATDKDQFIGWDTTGLLTSSDVRGAQGMTGRARFFISASISAISRGAELIRSSPRSVIT